MRNVAEVRYRFKRRIFAVIGWTVIFTRNASSALVEEKFKSESMNHAIPVTVSAEENRETGPQDCLLTKDKSSHYFILSLLSVIVTIDRKLENDNTQL